MNQFLATQTLKNQDLIKDFLLIFSCFYVDKMREKHEKDQINPELKGLKFAGQIFFPTPKNKKKRRPAHRCQNREHRCPRCPPGQSRPGR